MNKNWLLTVDRHRGRRTFVKAQIIVVTATVLLGVLAFIVPVTTGHERLYGLIPLLDVGRESNIPTYVSTINLVVAALICFSSHKIAALKADRTAYHWLVLAAIFFYLSADEGAMIHEKFDNLRVLIPDSSIVDARHSWLFLGTIVAALLAAMMVPFLFMLPRATALAFVGAGALFAGGAIGMEFVGSLMINLGIDPSDNVYQVRRLFEEGFEMYGIVIFNCVAAGELVTLSDGLELNLT